jgi:hypothetical protein
MSGWIKLQRKLLDWEWFTDVNTCHLFTYLLLSATHTEVKWRGVILMPGQLVTGRISMAQKTGLSEQQVRTSIDKLKATSEITSKPFNKYSVITITNWKIYQDSNQQNNQQITNNQPADNQQVTTFNNANKVNKEKNEIIDIGDFDDFWNCYGYKVGKSEAKKAYARALKSGVKHEAIIQGVKAYQKDCQTKGLEVKFFKHPATWLNGKNWEDEYLEGTASLSKEDEADRIKRIIEESKKCKSTNLLLT